MNLKPTVRSEISETFIGASLTLRRAKQPRTNIVKDKKGDLVTGCHSILASWRDHFSQLFSVHGVSVIRQTEIHTAEPLVPEPNAFEFEMAIEKLKRHITRY